MRYGGNLHITPALEGIIVEVHSLEEVTHWAKKGHLGSADTHRAQSCQLDCCVRP